MILIIGVIAISFVAAFVIAPILMINDRKLIKEMQAVVDEYDDNMYKLKTPEAKESARRNAKMRLVGLKAKIFIGDKKAVEAARDLINTI